MFLGNSSVEQEGNATSTAEFRRRRFRRIHFLGFLAGRDAHDLDGCAGHVSGGFSPGGPLGMIALRKYRALRQLTDCPFHLRRNGVQVL